MNKKILFLVLLLYIFILPISAQGSGDLVCEAVGNIELLMARVGGSIIVIGWVIAGILYLTSAGNPEKTGIARKALIAAVTGTIVLVLAATAVDIIIDALGKGTTDICL